MRELLQISLPRDIEIRGPRYNAAVLSESTAIVLRPGQDDFLVLGLKDIETRAVPLQRKTNVGKPEGFYCLARVDERSFLMHDPVDGLVKLLDLDGRILKSVRLPFRPTALALLDSERLALFGEFQGHMLHFANWRGELGKSHIASAGFGFPSFSDRTFHLDDRGYLYVLTEPGAGVIDLWNPASDRLVHRLFISPRSIVPVIQRTAFLFSGTTKTAKGGTCPVPGDPCLTMGYPPALPASLCSLAADGQGGVVAVLGNGKGMVHLSAELRPTRLSLFPVRTLNHKPSSDRPLVFSIDRVAAGWMACYRDGSLCLMADSDLEAADLADRFRHLEPRLSGHPQAPMGNVPQLVPDQMQKYKNFWRSLPAGRLELRLSLDANGVVISAEPAAPQVFGPVTYDETLVERIVREFAGMKFTPRIVAGAAKPSNLHVVIDIAGFPEAMMREAGSQLVRTEDED